MTRFSTGLFAKVTTHFVSNSIRDVVHIGIFVVATLAVFLTVSSLLEPASPLRPHVGLAGKALHTVQLTWISGLALIWSKYPLCVETLFSLKMLPLWIFVCCMIDVLCMAYLETALNRKRATYLFVSIISWMCLIPFPSIFHNYRLITSPVKAAENSKWNRRYVFLINVVTFTLTLVLTDWLLSRFKMDVVIFSYAICLFLLHLVVLVNVLMLAITCRIMHYFEQTPESSTPEDRITLVELGHA
jgi:hypothetical protein